MNFSPKTAVMNFLNEVAEQYPAAISFAAGRPTDHFLDRLNHVALLDKFGLYARETSSCSEVHYSPLRLLQYGRTSGMINDLVAQQLRVDECIPATSDRLLITSGCQEALALCLPVLCSTSSDVLLVCNPTYVGAVGAARASNIPVVPVPNVSSDLAGLIDQSTQQLRRRGRTVRALYLIPTFDNPTGRTLNERQRKDVLAVCARHRIIILEDNPYGMFRFEGEAVSPMAALDEVGSVIYLSSYSKTLAPALRIGAVTLPDTLFGDRAAREALMSKLVERKSFLTLNTSQLNQGIVGGILLQQNCSLLEWIQPALALYRENRDAMLGQLRSEFAAMSDQVEWNHPEGGFFLSMKLQFVFDHHSVIQCATEYGIIVTPMSFFALDNSQDRSIRLAFSALSPNQIREGITSLARFLAQRANVSGSDLENIPAI